MKTKAEQYRANMELCLMMTEQSWANDRAAWLELAETWRTLLRASEVVVIVPLHDHEPEAAKTLS